MTRRPLVVAALGLAVVGAVAAPAVAWVALSASTDVAADAGSLGTPTGLTTSVTATGLGGGEVRLGWHAPSGVAGDGWQVERQAVGSDPDVWAVASLTTPPACDADGRCTALDTHAQPGTSFRYRVRMLLHSWSGPASHRRLSASLTPAGGRVAVDASGLRGLGVSASGSRGLAVGDGGAMLTCDPGIGCTGQTAPVWIQGSRPTPADLRAAAYADDSNAWAVGDGTVWHCTDDCWDESAAWQEDAAATTLLGGDAATGVTVGQDGEYVAVVGGGRYLYSTNNGGTWQDGTAAVGAPPGTTLLGVAGPDGTEVVVIGSDGFTATCRTAGPACGEPGTFTPPTGGPTLRLLTYDAGDQSYLGATTDGALLRARRDDPATWAPDPADAGAPAPLHGLAAATAGDVHHVWAVAPGGPGVGASTIWHHDGTGWAAQPLHRPVDDVLLAADDESPAYVPASGATSLPADCAAPALLATVDVPAGPAPAAGPDVDVRLRLVTDGDADDVQVLGSLDGLTWGPPAALAPDGDVRHAALTAPTWDTTEATTLHLCVMARGGNGLAVDSLRVGVQE